MSTTETNGEQRSKVPATPALTGNEVRTTYYYRLQRVRCTALSFGHLFSSLESSGSFLITCSSLELAQMNASACRRHK